MTSSPPSPVLLATPHGVRTDGVMSSQSTTPSSLPTHRSGRHEAIPDMNMPQDFGDLLFGLGADDLNDFGDLDDFGIEEPVKQDFKDERAARSRSETREISPQGEKLISRRAILTFCSYQSNF